MTDYKVLIGDVEYTRKDIKSAKIVAPLFDKFSVGNTCSAELTLSVWMKEEIPRMAKIVPYGKDETDGQWHKLGGFYLDTRTQKNSLLEIVAYDGMLKSEIEWYPSQDLSFPMTMEVASMEIADLMGMQLDERCQFNPSYMVDSYPDSETTLRQVLGYIAAAHCGNWIVTADEKLLLVPLFGDMPPETNYLVEEYGNPITFGGTRILV